jgi:alpha-mannosidase
MPDEHRVQIDRIRGWVRQVLGPARFAWTEPLTAEAWQTEDRVPVGAAERAGAAMGFVPVRPGWRWGPAWSTCWFRLRGRLPEHATAIRGIEPTLRFSSGTEALLWWGPGGQREPLHGFDSNRDLCRLGGRVRAGRPFDVLVEAACNHWFGVTAFAWDPIETQDRWTSETPGELQRAELVGLRHGVDRLTLRLGAICDLLETFEPDDIRARRLREAVASAIRGAGEDDVRDPERLAALEEHLDICIDGVGPDGAATRCIATGHAHIDTAWLWPLAETRRKCLRSFSNALALLDREPDVRFSASQPQQYAWVEEDAPALFERIRTAVAEGRWEPVGAAWVEFDANVPNGESLLRQIELGTQWFRQRFGAELPQRVLFLPDTFGFPATLPTIMQHAGLDVLVTNKLAWNRRNAFPHPSFRWRGTDGSTVLAHQTPGGDYNARLHPAELRRAERRLAEGEGGLVPVWLQPFGYGDGGGGPDDAMVERGRLAGRLPGLPRVEFGTVHEFAQRLDGAIARMPERGPSALPTWEGELALELHRGTFTTHARLKQVHRRCELGLRRVEWLLAAAPAARRAPAVAPDQLDAAWRTLLLQQFHDILPGTSIEIVGRESLQTLQELHTQLEAWTDELARGWADALSPAGDGPEILVIEPNHIGRDGVIETADGPRWCPAVPGLGAIACNPAPAPPAGVAPVRVDQTAADGAVTLENDALRVTIDADGRIGSLVHRPTGRECRTPGGEPLATLRLHDDHPHEWDAWEIDPEHEESGRVMSATDAPAITVDHGGLRADVSFDVDLGEAGTARMTHRLEAGSPLVELILEIDWTADHRLLRLGHELAVHATHAACDVGFGTFLRPLARNAPVERQRFESCAHRWVAVQEPGFGVAMLNDGRYGHAIATGFLGLTLLRSPRHPDPTMDRGQHRVRTALMPFAGDAAARDVGVPAAAFRFNEPPRVVGPVPAGVRHQPIAVDVDGEANIEVTACRPDPAGSGDVLLRVVELRGARGELTVHDATGAAIARDPLAPAGGRRLRIPTN